MHGSVALVVAVLLPHSLALSGGIADPHGRPPASECDAGGVAERALAPARTGGPFVLLLAHPKAGGAGSSMRGDSERAVSADGPPGGS